MRCELKKNPYWNGYTVFYQDLKYVRLTADALCLSYETAARIAYREVLRRIRRDLFPSFPVGSWPSIRRRLVIYLPFRKTGDFVAVQGVDRRDDPVVNKS